jgi:hypothetical protein
MTNLSYLTVSFQRQKHMNTVLYVLPRKVVSVMFNKVRGDDEISLAPPGARDIFPFYTASSPIFLCKPGLFSHVQSGKEVQLTARIHEVPKLGTCGATSPLPTQLHMVELS